MKKFILAAIATATLVTPFVAATAADAQTRRTVIVERGPRGHVVRRVVVRRPYHGWQRRHHGYVTRRVVTRYR
jgi:Ni/Co efflux regulator RcnB